MHILLRESLSHNLWKLATFCLFLCWSEKYLGIFWEKYLVIFWLWEKYLGTFKKKLFPAQLIIFTLSLKLCNILLLYVDQKNTKEYFERKTTVQCNVSYSPHLRKFATFCLLFCGARWDQQCRRQQKAARRPQQTSDMIRTSSSSASQLICMAMYTTSRLLWPRDHLLCW